MKCWWGWSGAAFCGGLLLPKRRFHIHISIVQQSFTIIHNYYWFRWDFIIVLPFGREMRLASARLPTFPCKRSICCSANRSNWNQLSVVLQGRQRLPLILQRLQHSRWFGFICRIANATFGFFWYYINYCNPWVEIAPLLHFPCSTNYIELLRFLPDSMLQRISWIRTFSKRRIGRKFRLKWSGDNWMILSIIPSRSTSSIKNDEALIAI